MDNDGRSLVYITRVIVAPAVYPRLLVSRALGRIHNVSIPKATPTIHIVSAWGLRQLPSKRPGHVPGSHAFSGIGYSVHSRKGRGAPIQSGHQNKDPGTHSAEPIVVPKLRVLTANRSPKFRI